MHICTPNNTHAELAVQALENHKHVMCEKPMAINGEQAYQMEQAAQKERENTDGRLSKQV